MKNVIIAVTLSAVFALMFVNAAGALAQTSGNGKSKSGSPMMSKMMEGCEEMKAQKAKMREDGKAGDARLTDQLAAMNRMSADSRVGPLAAIVTEMVEQKIAMDARKASMEDAMMQHMMKHMGMGGGSMAQCPMMKGMGEKSGGDSQSVR